MFNKVREDLTDKVTWKDLRKTVDFAILNIRNEYFVKKKAWARMVLSES